MSTPCFRVGVSGFTAAERNALEVFFRLASARSPRYDACTELSRADFVLVDGDDDEAIERARHRLADALVIGVSLPPRGVMAALSRPLDPLAVMARLDQCVARRDELGVSALPGPGTKKARPAVPSAMARQGARHDTVQDFRASTGFSNSVLADGDLRLDEVLVVDDSPIARRYLQARLERLGYHVSCADSGEEALELVASRRFGFVFLDVAMSGMDGFEACRRIKQQPWPIGRCPAVVMVTGRTGAVDRIRGTLAGCEAYLTKPLAEEELVKVLAKHDHVFDRVFEPTVPGFGGEARTAWGAGE